MYNVHIFLASRYKITQDELMCHQNQSIYSNSKQFKNQKLFCVFKKEVDNLAVYVENTFLMIYSYVFTQPLHTNMTWHKVSFLSRGLKI